MMATAPVVRKVVEYYTIELAQLSEGGFGVSMIATTVDDEEPQLLSQELANARVDSLDDALSLVRDGVLGAKA